MFPTLVGMGHSDVKSVDARRTFLHLHGKHIGGAGGGDRYGLGPGHCQH